MTGSRAGEIQRVGAMGLLAVTRVGWRGAMAESGRADRGSLKDLDMSGDTRWHSAIRSSGIRK